MLRAMRILIVGGTVFLGPALIEAARARGHEVTVFHRGRHALADAASNGVAEIVGDRNRPADVDLLAAGTWDVAFDTCGYVPRHVRDIARVLEPRCGRYVFVSSVSALAQPFSAADEDCPDAAAVADGVEQVTGETYGPLKAACERAARDAFGERALVVRPGLIVGPRDPSDRYTYWVRRLDRGGVVLAPGDGSRLVQCVDVRDLAEFSVAAAAAGASGKFHVCGRPQRFDAFLAAIAAGAGVTPTLRWMPEETLVARGVAPWTDLPVWIAGEDQTTGIRRALAAGLRVRDPVETARATAAWDRTRDPLRPLATGLTPEREAAVLAGG